MNDLRGGEAVQYDELFDETPEQRLIEILRQANEEISLDVLDDFLTRHAAMELLLQQKFGEECDVAVQNIMRESSESVHKEKQGLCIHLMGEIVSRNE